ncbi:MAG: putative nucleotidyltransferase substrate binding domain-containing protein, partial [Gammaproteobacteria bacterium]
FFRNFVLVKDGEHDRTLDLKHSGVIPIVDLARVYALAGAVAAVNTLERLDAAAAAGTVSPAGSADLRSAMEFIGSLRLRHEANRIRDDLEPDNFVPPEELSHLERSQLKDAFSVVRTMQSALAQRYQASRLR